MVAERDAAVARAADAALEHGRDKAVWESARSAEADRRARAERAQRDADAANAAERERIARESAALVVEREKIRRESEELELRQAENRSTLDAPTAEVAAGKWRILYSLGSARGGVVLPPRAVFQSCFSDHGIFVLDGKVTVAIRCAEVNPELSLKQVAEHSRSGADDFLGARAVSAEAATGGGVGTPDPPENDVRVLGVLYDSAEERYRSYESAVNSCFEEDFVDWPLEGPRSTLTVLRQLRRDGRSFLQHHDEWVQRSQIDGSNRAVHEHRLLSRSLHLAVTYDQVHAPNLASIEILVRRRMLIERAHSGGRGAQPVYEGSEHFMGLREATDGSVIDPALVRYTAERLHADSEILRKQRLSGQERRAAGLPLGQQARNADEDEDGGAAAAAGPPKGKGKKDRGSRR